MRTDVTEFRKQKAIAVFNELRDSSFSTEHREKLKLEYHFGEKIYGWRKKINNLGFLESRLEKGKIGFTRHANA